MLLLQPHAMAAESAHAHSHASSASAQEHGHKHEQKHEHKHDHDSASAPASANGQLVLNHGKKWASDAALRTAMQKVAVLAGKTGTPDPAKAKQIADGINQQVSYMVKNCHLEAKADAVLHALIADLLAGASAVTDPAKADAGIAQIRQALRQYPQYFNHPLWRG